MVVIINIVKLSYCLQTDDQKFGRLTTQEDLSRIASVGKYGNANDMVNSIMNNFAGALDVCVPQTGTFKNYQPVSDTSLTGFYRPNEEINLQSQNYYLNRQNFRINQVQYRHRCDTSDDQTDCGANCNSGVDTYTRVVGNVTRNGIPIITRGESTITIDCFDNRGTTLPNDVTFSYTEVRGSTSTLTTETESAFSISGKYAAGGFEVSATASYKENTALTRTNTLESTTAKTQAYKVPANTMKIVIASTRTDTSVSYYVLPIAITGSHDENGRERQSLLTVAVYNKDYKTGCCPLTAYQQPRYTPREFFGDLATSNITYKIVTKTTYNYLTYRDYRSRTGSCVSPPKN